MRRFCDVIAFALVIVCLFVSLITFLIYTGKAEAVFQFVCAKYCDSRKFHTVAAFVAEQIVLMLTATAAVSAAVTLLCMCYSCAKSWKEGRNEV